DDGHVTIEVRRVDGPPQRGGSRLLTSGRCRASVSSGSGKRRDDPLAVRAPAHVDRDIWDPDARGRSGRLLKILNELETELGGLAMNAGLTRFLLTVADSSRRKAVALLQKCKKPRPLEPGDRQSLDSLRNEASRTAREMLRIIRRVNGGPSGDP